jgi:uncharacterized membrane protein YgcG
MIVVVLEAWCLCTVAVLSFLAEYIDEHPPVDSSSSQLPKVQVSQANSAAQAATAAGALAVAVIALAAFFAWRADRPSAAVQCVFVRSVCARSVT